MSMVSVPKQKMFAFSIGNQNEATTFIYNHKKILSAVFKKGKSLAGCVISKVVKEKIGRKVTGISKCNNFTVYFCLSNCFFQVKILLIKGILQGDQN